MRFSPTSTRPSTTRRTASRVGVSMRRTVSRSRRSSESRRRVCSPRPAFDSVLDLGALVVQGVRRVEVSLGDDVEKVMRDLAGGADPACIAGGLDRFEVERRRTGRRLPHREGETGCQHEVDLAEVDAVVLALDLGRDEHAEHVVAVRLERQAPRRRVRRAPRALADADHRACVDQFLPRRVEQVDPARTVVHRARLAARSAGGGARQAGAVCSRAAVRAVSG